MTENQKLREVATELDRLMLVIESAVRYADPRNHASVMALILANKEALALPTAASTVKECLTVDQINEALDALRLGRVALEWSGKLGEVGKVASAMETLKDALRALPPTTLLSAAPDNNGSALGSCYPETAPPVVERYSVKHEITQGGYRLFTVTDSDSQCSEVVFPDDNPVLYGLLTELGSRAALSAGDAVDAQRYRWLREQNDDDFVFAVVKSPHFDVYESPEELDAAIDAAMRKGQL